MHLKENLREDARRQGEGPSGQESPEDRKDISSPREKKSWPRIRMRKVPRKCSGALGVLQAQNLQTQPARERDGYHGAPRGSPFGSRKRRCLPPPTTPTLGRAVGASSLGWVPVRVLGPARQGVARNDGGTGGTRKPATSTTPSASVSSG